jgi:hypothetical protein
MLPTTSRRLAERLERHENAAARAARTPSRKQEAAPVTTQPPPQDQNEYLLDVLHNEVRDVNNSTPLMLHITYINSAIYLCGLSKSDLFIGNSPQQALSAFRMFATGYRAAQEAK